MMGKEQTVSNKRFEVFFVPLACLLLFVFIVSGCTNGDIEKPLPIELAREHACAVCGMITVDFPGAKAQIHYKNGKIDTFCCTLHMFSFYLQPDRPKHISAIYVNDMGKADWDQPKGQWIDAKKAYYVVGGDVMGPHGEALLPFAATKDAEGHISDHRGRIISFDEVNEGILRPNAHHAH